MVAVEGLVARPILFVRDDRVSPRLPRITCNSEPLKPLKLRIPQTGLGFLSVIQGRHPNRIIFGISCNTCNAKIPGVRRPQHVKLNSSVNYKSQGISRHQVQTIHSTLTLLTLQHQRARPGNPYLLNPEALSPQSFLQDEHNPDTSNPQPGQSLDLNSSPPNSNDGARSGVAASTLCKRLGSSPDPKCRAPHPKLSALSPRS